MGEWHKTTSFCSQSLTSLGNFILIVITSLGKFVLIAITSLGRFYRWPHWVNLSDCYYQSNCVTIITLAPFLSDKVAGCSTRHCWNVCMGCCCSRWHSGASICSWCWCPQSREGCGKGARRWRVFDQRAKNFWERKDEAQLWRPSTKGTIIT